MGSSFRIQRFRVWFPPGDPPREGFVTQAGELCLQAGSYSFLPPQRGSTTHEFLFCNKSPHLLTAGRRSLQSIPTMTHCFSLHRQFPCFPLWRKAKSLQLNNSCPLPPKNTIQETLGKRILPSNTSWPIHIKSFLLKFPFISHLNASTLFSEP